MPTTSDAVQELHRNELRRYPFRIGTTSSVQHISLKQPDPRNSEEGVRVGSGPVWVEGVLLRSGVAGFTGVLGLGVAVWFERGVEVLGKHCFRNKEVGFQTNNFRFDSGGGQLRGRVEMY